MPGLNRPLSGVPRLAVALTVSLLAGALVLPVWAVPASSSPLLVRDARFTPAHLPRGARALGAVAPSTPLSVDFVFASSDPSGESALLASMEDPASPAFHHWITPGEFAARFGPSAVDRGVLDRWLGSQGLPSASVSGLVAGVRAPAGSLARALGVPIDRFSLPGGSTMLRTAGPPALPASLAGRLLAVSGLSGLPRLHPHMEHATSPRIAATPANIGDHYGIGTVISAGDRGSGQSIALYELAAHSASDISAYEKKYGFTNPVSTVRVDGGAPLDFSTGGTEEADLDIEVALSEAPGASIVSYEGPQTGTGPLDVYNAIVQADTSQVISASWGDCEADYASSDFSSYHAVIQQAALQGQSNFAAAGDTGSEDCYQSDNTEVLAVDYPGSDPYVTDVGGTTRSTPDSVWNDCLGAGSDSCARSRGGSGGGGLSAQWAKPSWQDSLGVPSGGGGSCAGSCRGVPDLSADADPSTGYEIYYDGGTDVVGGTSAAAPLVAGLNADVDQSCAASTGELAPLLAALAGQSGAYGADLTDVVSGNNDLTATNGGKYAAGTGFDLASGLGTPWAPGLVCPEVTGVSPGTAAPGQQVTLSGSNLAHAQIYFGAASAAVVSASANQATVTVPAGSGTVSLGAGSPVGRGSGTVPFSFAGASQGPGYWLLSAGGTVYPFGSAGGYGNASFGPGQGSAAAMSALPGGSGYWITSTTGAVQSFGSAASLTPSQAPSGTVVAIAATADGTGYWLATSTGQVLTAGDAVSYGSPQASGLHLHGAIVNIVRTPSGAGYWLLGSDGGVFTYGDAGFFGSTGSIRLDAPAVAMAPTADGAGYWFVAGDGGVFTFGDAAFFGSMGGKPLNRPMIGMVVTPDGSGYWLDASDGGVFTFGDAGYLGSLGGSPPPTPIVAMAVS